MAYKINNPQDRAVMGQFLREMQETQNLNTFIHGFYRPRYAFTPSAVVVQQKKFPDVSFYQGAINWNTLYAMTDTVVIRAGQNSWVDTEFLRNWAGSKVRKMKRGVYWFFDGRATPTAQADLLVSLIKDDLPEMEIWIDWEHNYGGSYEGLANVVAMMQRVELLLPGTRVGLYTGYYWFIQNSNPITHAAQYSYLKNKPLWEAWYTSDASLVKIPQPWTSLLVWQFGTPSEGAQYGVITPNIDMNYFNGTLSDFETRYGAITPPPPPTGESMNGTAKENGGRIGKIRTTPSRWGTQTGTSPAGATIEFVRVANSIDTGVYAADQWFELPDGRYLNYIISGEKYFTILTMPTTEPTPPAVESIYISHTFTDTLIVDNPDGTTQTYSANFTVPDVEYKPNP